MLKALNTVQHAIKVQQILVKELPGLPSDAPKPAKAKPGLAKASQAAFGGA